MGLFWNLHRTSQVSWWSFTGFVTGAVKNVSDKSRLPLGKEFISRKRTENRGQLTGDNLSPRCTGLKWCVLNGKRSSWKFLRRRCESKAKLITDPSHVLLSVYRCQNICSIIMNHFLNPHFNQKNCRVHLGRGEGGRGGSAEPLQFSGRNRCVSARRWEKVDVIPPIMLSSRKRGYWFSKAWAERSQTQKNWRHEG